ncbi:MAG: cytochrome c-type biogenesis protein CcmH [Chloroflexi bacterium]|nr:cytochrome c-type biogenesis protein CcmH [Chloroflexota bacterium]
MVLVSDFLFIDISIRKRALVGSLLVLLVLASLGAPGAVRAQEYVELTPELDARAADLYAGIMCPICNGQTISQSHAAISETMRQMVRERLVAGDTDQQIYDFMTEAFGRDILASPPKSGIGLAVWFVPPVALLLGAFAVTLFVRRLRSADGLVRQGSGAGPGDLADAHGGTGDGLEPYLQLVDEEMPDIEERP